jgi:hypothetical protein
MKPTAKQLAYLRALAIRTGQTFTRPASRSEASREIQRLSAATPSDRGEQRREEREIRDALTRGAGTSAAVRDHEISGYGSSCEWS